MYLAAGLFSVTPRNVTSFLGREAEFRCKVDAPNILTWEIDTIPAINLNAARNITFRTERTGENEESTLLIAATVINNRSEVICIASRIGGIEIARTQAAFLYTQGTPIITN